VGRQRGLRVPEFARRAGDAARARYCNEGGQIAQRERHVVISRSFIEISIFVFIFSARQNYSGKVASWQMITAARTVRVPSALVLWSSVVVGAQIGVARLGYGLALPAIRQSLLGDYALYGAINAVSLGGYLVGALLAPMLMRRVNSLVLASSAVAGAALAASAFASGPLTFGVARTVFGIASGVALVTAAVQTLESVEAARHGGASAVMWAGIGAGLALSALGAPRLLHAALAWRIASLGAGALTLVAGVGYSTVWQAGSAATVHHSAGQAHGEPGRFDRRDLLRPRRFLFLCLSYGAFGFAYIAYATFIVASIKGRLSTGAAAATVEHLWGLYGRRERPRRARRRTAAWRTAAPQRTGVRCGRRRRGVRRCFGFAADGRPERNPRGSRPKRSTCGRDGIRACAKHTGRRTRRSRGNHRRIRSRPTHRPARHRNRCRPPRLKLRCAGGELRLSSLHRVRSRRCVCRTRGGRVIDGTRRTRYPSKAISTAARLPRVGRFSAPAPRCQDLPFSG